MRAKTPAGSSINGTRWSEGLDAVTTRLTDAGQPAAVVSIDVVHQ
jgi:hypothetical protein